MLQGTLTMDYGYRVIPDYGGFRDTVSVDVRWKFEVTTAR